MKKQAGDACFPPKETEVRRCLPKLLLAQCNKAGWGSWDSDLGLPEPHPFPNAPFIVLIQVAHWHPDLNSPDLECPPFCLNFQIQFLSQSTWTLKISIGFSVPNSLKMLPLYLTPKLDKMFLLWVPITSCFYHIMCFSVLCLYS